MRRWVPCVLKSQFNGAVAAYLALALQRPHELERVIDSGTP